MNYRLIVDSLVSVTHFSYTVFLRFPFSTILYRGKIIYLSSYTIVLYQSKPQYTIKSNKGFSGINDIGTYKRY